MGGVAACATTFLGSKAWREGILVKKAEYLVDRINFELENCRCENDYLKAENKALREECIFGAGFALLVGLAIGIVLSWFVL